MGAGLVLTILGFFAFFIWLETPTDDNWNGNNVWFHVVPTIAIAVVFVGLIALALAVGP